MTDGGTTLDEIWRILPWSLNTMLSGNTAVTDWRGLCVPGTESHWLDHGVLHLCRSEGLGVLREHAPRASLGRIRIMLVAVSCKEHHR